MFALANDKKHMPLTFQTLHKLASSDLTPKPKPLTDACGTRTAAKAERNEEAALRTSEITGVTKITPTFMLF